MKKISIILLILLTLTLTGCGNTKTLTCKTSSNFHGLDSDATIKLKIRNDELTDANIEIDIEADEVGRKSIINYFNQSSKKMQILETSTGVKLSGGMDSEFFEALSLTQEIKYGEVKQVMELQGYTCE